MRAFGAESRSGDKLLDREEMAILGELLMAYRLLADRIEEVARPQTYTKEPLVLYRYQLTKWRDI